LLVSLSAPDNKLVLCYPSVYVHPHCTRWWSYHSCRNIFVR